MSSKYVNAAAGLNELEDVMPTTQSKPSWKALAGILLALNPPQCHTWSSPIECHSMVKRMSFESRRSSLPTARIEEVENEIDEEDERKLKEMIAEAEWASPQVRGRRLRLGASGAGILVGAASLLIAILVLTKGSEELPFDAENLLVLGNPIIAVLFDIALIGLTGKGIQVELDYSKKEIDRITKTWKEKRVRESKTASFTKNQETKSSDSKSLGFAGGTGTKPRKPKRMADPAPSQVEEATNTEHSTDTKPDALQNFMDRMREISPEADVLARNSAMELNKKLEDAGVLPPVQTPTVARSSPVESTPERDEVATTGSAPLSKSSGKKGARKNRRRQKKR